MMSNRQFFDSKDEAVALTTQLKMLGVAKVQIDFAGSGDSGSIDGTYLLDANENHIDMPTDMIAWTTQVYGEQKAEQKLVKLRDALEDIGYRVLDETGMDWYNNDGGQGYIFLDIENEVFGVRVEMEINITHTEDHNFEYDPNHDEDIFYPTEGEA
jgi:hypothetical protein